MKKTLLSLLLLLGLTHYSLSQELIRGPYQQGTTTHSVKIMWRTSIPTKGWVKIGNTPENLTKNISETDLASDHTVYIDNLEAFTTYYYSVGYDDITLASGIDHYFTTNQLEGDTIGFSVWIIGDFGTGDEPQKMAKNAFLDYSKTHPVNFMLTLGDNAYPEGADQDYQSHLFDIYDSILRFMHYYPTPGNHDYDIIRGDNVLGYLDPTLDDGPYFHIHEMPIHGEAGGYPSDTKLYYSFNYGNAHFICLNSETYTWTQNGTTPLKTWLKKDLEANQQHWTIVYFHQSPYTRSSDSSDDFYEIGMRNMRMYILPILEEYGVDLVYTGHSHDYERSYLINGHYKNSPQWNPAINLIDGRSGNPDLGETYVKNIEDGKGTVYTVCGNSGRYINDDKLFPTLHPVMYYRDGGTEETGSVVLEVKGSTVTSTYINKKGEILDKFSIFKQSPQTVATHVKDKSIRLFDIKAYPNPSSKYLSLEFNNPSGSKANLSILDLSGKLLLHQSISNQGRNKLEIKKWQSLPNGNYTLNLDIDGKSASLNVVKQ
ncbi:MAG: metallophosphoesterase [Chitinophagales bacterium]|nr:metallophosphoesterase [Chitinophagales bacterium]